MVIKKTLVSFYVGTKLHSFFVNARYVDGKAQICQDVFYSLLIKAKAPRSVIMM